MTLQMLLRDPGFGKMWGSTVERGQLVVGAVSRVIAAPRSDLPPQARWPGGPRGLRMGFRLSGHPVLHGWLRHRRKLRRILSGEARRRTPGRRQTDEAHYSDAVEDVIAHRARASGGTPTFQRASQSNLDDHWQRSSGAHSSSTGRTTSEAEASSAHKTPLRVELRSFLSG